MRPIGVIYTRRGPRGARTQTDHLYKRQVHTHAHTHTHTHTHTNADNKPTNIGTFESVAFIPLIAGARETPWGIVAGRQGVT